ncbi:hypothetical protein NDU88_001839 [Pleurodeles waltl]|uniref:Chemokine interleukin-8-like domain-containing protein n=1 Tax=Pleurodeles waltl TaxID=8319 RepID=A0AAV7U7Z2_PLEWA|nr:hypothetical protein NDU88_001839 [Pleurodeles waltl]
MKISLAAVSVLLLALFCTEILADTDPPICCHSYAPRKIPQRHVQEYYLTSKECPLPAVVFITGRRRLVCADPKSTWVQDYIQYLERRFNPAPATSA